MTGGDLRARFSTVTTTDGQGAVTFSSLTEAEIDALADLIDAASNMLQLHDEKGDPWAPTNGEGLRRSLAALDRTP